MTNKKILIVDDEIELAESVDDLLEFEGYDTQVVHTGEEALESVESQIPDVVFLDIQLPGINGIEVLRILKQKHPTLPILIVSASSQAATRKEAEDCGADGIFLKPFNEDELLQHIRKLCNEGE